MKQGSLNWHNTLKGALLDRDFVESISDSYVFISKDMVVLVYVDDCILISKEEASIKSFVKSLENGPETFVFTAEGTMDSCLDVNIE